PQESERKHQVPGRPHHAVDLGVLGRSKKFCCELGHGPAQPQIEQTEIADDHPGEREHAEALDAETANEKRYCHDASHGWDSLCRKTPKGTGRENTAAQEL